MAYVGTRCELSTEVCVDWAGGWIRIAEDRVIWACDACINHVTHLPETEPVDA